MKPIKNFLFLVKKIFWEGIIAAIFLIVIIMVLKTIFKFFYPFTYIANLMHLTFPGAELIILVVIVFTLGFILNYWQTKTGPFGELVMKIPILNKVAKIFTAIKNTVNSWFTRKEEKKENGFWVLIKWRPGFYSLAMTSYTSIAEINKAAGEDLIAVLPNSCPIPATGGTLLFTKKKNIIPLDIPFDIGWQLILSCGLLKLEDTKVELKKTPNIEKILKTD